MTEPITLNGVGATDDTTPTDDAQNLKPGDVVRHERMAADGPDNQCLWDCVITESYRTTLGSWRLEWRMVADDTVNGGLTVRPDTQIQVIARA